MLKRVLALVLWVLLPLAVAAAASESSHAVVAEHGSEAGHAPAGLPQAPPELPFKIGPLPVTNSMLVTWIVAAGLILFAQLATRNMKAVPEGLQNFWEWLVEGLYGFLEGIIGADLVKKTFWFFATIFIFILTCNWFGLIPGVGSIGWGHPDAQGHLGHLSEPLFRGANADLNMTLAMAMVFFACWTIWALQANGATGFFLHIF